MFTRFVDLVCPLYPSLGASLQALVFHHPCSLAPLFRLFDYVEMFAEQLQGQLGRKVAIELGAVQGKRMKVVTVEAVLRAKSVVVKPEK